MRLTPQIDCWWTYKTEGERRQSAVCQGPPESWPSNGGKSSDGSPPTDLRPRSSLPQIRRRSRRRRLSTNTAPEAPPQNSVRNGQSRPLGSVDTLLIIPPPATLAGVADIRAKPRRRPTGERPGPVLVCDTPQPPPPPPPRVLKDSGAGSATNKCP